MMRYARLTSGLFIAASVLLTPALVPGAHAQISYEGEGACNKGVFWPFVRNPGDCLTDTERRSGMSGTYRESELAEPAESAISEPEASAPEPNSEPTQTQQSAPSSAPNSPATSTPAAPAATATPPATPAPPAGAASTPTAPNEAAEDADAVPAAEETTNGGGLFTGEGGCSKGIFWPFVRSPGDCLTDTERRSGMTGTYQ